MDTWSERARSFGSVAESYDRLRPGYPPAAVDVALPAGARAVADVGAGTGKLTAALVARGLDVTAVEPDPDMRSLLAGRVPGARVLAGTAESLPLPDGSLDAVLFAQSWHWADPERALPEVARVLRPGGRLAMLWNIKDGRHTPWVRELDRVTRRGAGLIEDEDGDVPEQAGFGHGARTDVDWVQELTPGDLVDLAHTWSAVNTLPADERAAVLEDVRRLLATDEQTAGRERIGLPQVCMVLTYDLL